MRMKYVLPWVFMTLPLSVQAADREGWTDSLKQDMVSACVDSLRDTITADSREQLGLGASEPLPEETQRVLEDEFVPEFRNTCGCTMDRVAEQHTYAEVQNNPELVRQEAALVGTPEGCPLNLPGDE